MDSAKNCRIALFPGSFNPFTIGHKSIVDRALRLFDRVIIAVGYNCAKEPDCRSLDERMEAIRRAYCGNEAVEVASYSCLTADFVRQTGACVIVRGVRNTVDFEYERSIADINRRLCGVDTVLLYTLPEMESISSSIVRELERFGHDVGSFLP